MVARKGMRFWTAEEDAVLLAAIARGLTSQTIAAILGRTRQSVNARRHLHNRGLRKRPWAPAEDTLLRAGVGYRSATDLGREMGRSPGAVNTRASELGLRWNAQTDGRRHTGFTASDIARLLGLADTHAVTRWLRQGYLSGTKRAIRLPGDPARIAARSVAWRIMPDALRVFLRDYQWLYERERITDRGWAAYVATLPRETYIGTREAAERLYCTEANVAKMIRLGQIRAEKRGANWCIPVSAVATYQPPPMGGRPGSGVRDEVARQRARNLAQRKTQGYHSRPETVARQVAARAARKERAA